MTDQQPTTAPEPAPPVTEWEPVEYPAGHIPDAAAVLNRCADYLGRLSPPTVPPEDTLVTVPAAPLLGLLRQGAEDAITVGPDPWLYQLAKGVLGE